MILYVKLADTFYHKQFTTDKGKEGENGSVRAPGALKES